MDFKFENEDEKFREEVIDFIDKELPWDWRNLDLDAEALYSKLGAVFPVGYSFKLNPQKAILYLFSIFFPY